MVSEQLKGSRDLAGRPLEATEGFRCEGRGGKDGDKKTH